MLFRSEKRILSRVPKARHFALLIFFALRAGKIFEVRFEFLRVESRCLDDHFYDGQYLVQVRYHLKVRIDLFSHRRREPAFRSSSVVKARLPMSCFATSSGSSHLSSRRQVFHEVGLRPHRVLSFP
mgnify:CR=1 FL=1